MPAMPGDFSDMDGPFSTAGDMKFHLQNLLDSKEKQLQHAGSLGQRVLAQQMELEQRIRQLQELGVDKGEDDRIDHEARQHYRDLADTILRWDIENAELSSAFGGGSKHFPDGASDSLALSRKSATQSRRAKNAVHRADDVEFAFEIGSGLLTEVRRLQSLLGNRDNTIPNMKEEKEDLEKSIESLRTALRQQEQSADKFKEENWNLEVGLQELRSNYTDSQASVRRLESEHKRLTKSLANAHDTGDQHKDGSECLAMKTKHEIDIAQARKHAAGLQREKLELQQTIDTMKLEAACASRRLPRFGGQGPKDFPTLVGHGDNGDVFGTTRGASTLRETDGSMYLPPHDNDSGFSNYLNRPPLRKPFLAANQPRNEIEALQQRLAHAQRQVNTLKWSLNREKKLRMQLEAGIAHGDNGENEDDDVDENTAIIDSSTRSAKKPTPFIAGAIRGGRGRVRGRGVTLMQRLGIIAYFYDEEDEDPQRQGPPPPVRPAPYPL